MFAHLMVEKLYGTDKREQSMFFPISAIVVEAWYDGGIIAPNCCKITVHGNSYKVKGKTKEELISAFGLPVKELK